MAYTAQQLVSLACQIGKVQAGMAPQVGQFLNMLLANYARTMDLDTVRKIAVFNVSAANTGFGLNGAGYKLPADYLRQQQQFYNVDGTIFGPDQISLSRYNLLFQGTGIADYPESYATDISDQTVAQYGAGLIYFWPPPAIPLTMKLMYRSLPADIVSPQTSNVIPWFPDQLTLLKDLCAQAMMLGDDSRMDNFNAEVEKRMRKYLIMKDDEEGFAHTVKLDPQRFRSRDNLKPTKITSIF